MKIKNFFGFVNFLNFILASLFIGLVFYSYTVQDSFADNEIVLVFVTGVFLIIVAPFNWICYSLQRSLKHRQQLSGTIKTTGVIFCILFSLLTALEIIGAVDIFNRIITDSSNTIFLLFAALFFSLTLSSLYLCIAYWVLRKQTKTQFVDIVEELGQDAV